MAYRPDWWPQTDHDALGVLDIALAVHMHRTGATDPMSDDDYHTAIRCLQWLRDNWTTPMGKNKDFDNAVRCVVLAALHEDETDSPPF